MRKTLEARQWRSYATLFLAAALALVMVLILASRAEARVYWTDFGGTIGRAALDGSRVDESFITGIEPFLSGVAVDEAHIYWGRAGIYEAGDIGRANLDGSGLDQSFIPTPSAPYVAVDAAHIYWTNYFGGAIGRANLDGSGVDPSFITGIGAFLNGVAVDEAHVYWSHSGAIGRANLDGSGVDESFITGIQANGIAVDEGHIYWPNQEAGAIGRANLDGSGVDPSFITGIESPGPGHVAVDEAHVYWTNPGDFFEGEGEIGRANLDGSGVDQSFITIQDIPNGVAVDALPDVPPNTSIDSGPAEGLTINDTTPTFGFSSNEPSASFECRVDGGGYSACSSPFTTSQLSDGPHSFEVRAVDEDETPDPTPASRSFTIDTTPPETSIDSGPAEGLTINDDTPRFRFSSNEEGSSFECRLDSSQEADFEPCTSPQTLGPLSDGPHSFEVRATDQVGNTETSPASRSFTVDTVPPDTLINSGPAEGASTNDTTPTFGFASNEPDASFQCRLDGGGYSACSSPFTTSQLPDGPHSFEVRATDLAFNTDRSPALRNFTVDTTVPALAAPPPALPALPPDTVPPNAKLFGKRRQGAGKPIVIKVGCNEDCVVLATGRVVVWGAPHRGAARAARRQKARFRLRPLARRLSAGQVANLKLRPTSRKARRRLRRLVRKGRKAQAKIRVSYRDRAGNVSTARLTIGLRSG